jgi:hypothetical protein
MKRGTCLRDNTLTRANILCEISPAGYTPNDKQQHKLDRIASPVHADLKMRDLAQCSNCAYWKLEDGE